MILKIMYTASAVPHAAQTEKVWPSPLFRQKNRPDSSVLKTSWARKSTKSQSIRRSVKHLNTNLKPEPGRKAGHRKAEIHLHEVANARHANHRTHKT